MNNDAFHFEVKDILLQFVAAFDDARVKRFNASRTNTQQVAVRYIFGPKDRIIHDIVNPDHNIELPAVAINQTTLARDTARIQNKVGYTLLPTQTRGNVARIPEPTPVKIGVDVSIIARYKDDIDQIISNFVAYTNPYFVLAWKIPEAFGQNVVSEIRSTVNWSENVQYEYPSNIAYSEKFNVIANTSFEIETFLFSDVPQGENIIYKVDSNFHAAGRELISSSLYDRLSVVNNTETVTISAIPSITNVFYTTSGSNIHLFDDISVSNVNRNINLLVFGKRFSYSNSFYLSSNTTWNSLSSTYNQIDTAKSQTISAYKLPDRLITVVSDNIAQVIIPQNYLTSGIFTLVTANSAGWASSYNASSSTITII